MSMTPELIDAMKRSPTVRALLKASDRAYENSITRLADDLHLPRPLVSSMVDQDQAAAMELLWYGECPGFVLRATDEGPVLERDDQEIE